MSTSEKRIKIAAAILTCLFFIALAGVVTLHDSNNSLAELLDGSKLKSESLLSEKLLHDKEINNLRTQIASQEGQNKDLDQLLSNARKQLEQKQREIAAKGPNVKYNRELADLKRIKTDLERQMADLNIQMRSLESSNSELTAQLSEANAKNKELAGSIKAMETLAINNYRIDATKKNDKLTVVARKTKNLSMGFDLPVNLAENVQFKIKTPEGKVIDKSCSELAYGIESSPNELFASVEPIALGMEVSKRVEMSYKPKERMKKGLYVIDIYNGETYVTSCQVRLK